MGCDDGNETINERIQNFLPLYPSFWISSLFDQFTNNEKLENEPSQSKLIC